MLITIVIKMMMIASVIKVVMIDDSQPQSAFLHDTILESGLQGIVVVPKNDEKGVQCTKKHESKDFISCCTSIMTVMLKMVMLMLMLRVLFGANKIWFLPGCEAWCRVVLVPPGHPLH